MTTHLSWEALNDLADGTLSASERASASAHIQSCAPCAEQLAALQALLSSAAAMPDVLTAPSEAWPAIAQTIDRTKTVALPVSAAAHPGLRVSRTQIAAAAVLLIAVSSAVTSILVRRQPVDVGSTRVAAVGGLHTVTSEVSLIEGEYLSTAAQLRATLEREREGLSPSTIATVERSLTIIDDAIAEAREALVKDPSNDALRSLLRRSHQQKIEFLRRSTALLQKS